MVLGFTDLWVDAGVFLTAAAVVAVVGPRLSRAADRIGRVTGLGQTVAGAVLLGASTSLPGLIVTGQTALAGRPNMAVANALGGIAAQTLFVAFADVALRDDTIEHENALAASLLQSTVLISLLAVALLAMIRPDVVVYGSVHPASPVIVVGILTGFAMVNETRKHPSWRASGDGNDGGAGVDRTGNGARGSEGSSGTSGGSDGSGGAGSDSRDGAGSVEGLYRRYGAYVVAVAVAGYLISTSAGAIVTRTGLSPLVMGLTFTAIATSLPELVTAVASVRRGAVGLAIGDIVGGNAFDTVMVAIADFVFVPGSIYAAVSTDAMFVAGIALLMTGVLVSGFVRRDRRGLANIGVETYLVVLVYVVGVATVLLGKVVTLQGILP